MIETTPVSDLPEMVEIPGVDDEGFPADGIRAEAQREPDVGVVVVLVLTRLCGAVHSRVKTTT